MSGFFLGLVKILTYSLYWSKNNILTKESVDKRNDWALNIRVQVQLGRRYNWFE
jgi:hypothetical protein